MALLRHYFLDKGGHRGWPRNPIVRGAPPLTFLGFLPFLLLFFQLHPPGSGHFPSWLCAISEEKKKKTYYIQSPMGLCTISKEEDRDDAREHALEIASFLFFSSISRHSAASSISWTNDAALGSFLPIQAETKRHASTFHSLVSWENTCCGWFRCQHLSKLQG